MCACGDRQSTPTGCRRADDLAFGDVSTLELRVPKGYREAPSLSTDASDRRPHLTRPAVDPLEATAVMFIRQMFVQAYLPAAGLPFCRQMFVQGNLGCPARTCCPLPTTQMGPGERGMAGRIRRTADGLRVRFVERTSDRNHSPASCPWGDRSHWRTSRERCGRETSTMRACLLT